MSCESEDPAEPSVEVRLEEITELEDSELAGARKEIRSRHTVIIPENPFPEISVDAYPPLKFSWLLPGKLAAMALPRHKENLQYLVNEGITHLVTLSAGKKPPVSECGALRWSEIPVEEFQLPSVQQVQQFVCLCKNSDANGEVVGVHCRQGRSRCGVMLACYLVHFHRLMPHQAVSAVREMRTGSLETQEHVDAVEEYYQHIQTDNPVKFGVSPELRFLLTKYEERMHETEQKQLQAEKEAMREKTKLKDDPEAYPPFNFSWIVENKVAGMGWPQSVENLNYLVKVGINHLVTLSPERVPPILELSPARKLKWTEIPVKEFTAPSLRQILKFIDICQRGELRGEVIGVHCRQGRGRTGVMLAAYLVHAQNLAPERAVLTVRVQRPGSCETYEQEKAVCHYHDCLRGTIDPIDYLMVDNKQYFDRNVNEMDDNKPQGLPEPVIEEKETAAEKEEDKPKKTKAMVINHKIYF